MLGSRAKGGFPVMAGTMASLPAEKVSELRQMIHNHVNRADVMNKIQSCVEQTLGTVEGQLDETELLATLQAKGIVDDILSSLQLEETTHIQPPLKDELTPGDGFLEVGSACSCEDREPAAQSVHPTLKRMELHPHKRYLLVHVRGGRAFLEHINEEVDSSIPGHHYRRPTFTLYACFRGQRYQSREVPCSCDPDIHETFLLLLSRRHGTDDGVVQHLSSRDALSFADPVHLVLVRSDFTGEREVVGTARVEWRGALSADSGKLSVPVELGGYGAEARITAGVLEVQLEVVSRGTDSLQEDVVTTQLKIEQNRYSEAERMFLVYAKQWWREYLQIREGHSQRLVKIFAQDEKGCNWPVCAYIHTLRGGRLLESPRQAARFVSLIPYEKTSSAVGSGGCRAEVWDSMHTFLCRRKGDCEDHAVLLCSLLLGFGLQAFVCIGTKGKAEVHHWVMTQGHDGLVTFWESLTGQRFVHRSIDPTQEPGPVKLPRPDYPYRTVGCVFNHHSFYANVQHSDAIMTCRFDLHDPSLWKAMSSDALASVRDGAAKHVLCPVPLGAGSLDPVLVSNQLEAELRLKVAEHRHELGLTTAWNNTLSYILASALSAYELERASGLSVGNEEFQQAVRLNVPEGCTFKAFPVQFVHCNVARMFSTCLQSSICQEIVGCRGDGVEHSLRVSVYKYPEDVVAVWVMLAVQYRSVV